MMNYQSFETYQTGLIMTIIIYHFIAYVTFKEMDASHCGVKTKALGPYNVKYCSSHI